MAFKAFLIKVTYIDEVNHVVAVVEHRDTDIVIVRSYEFAFPVTVNAAKTQILSANATLNTSPPAIIATLQNLVGSEIT